MVSHAGRAVGADPILTVRGCGGKVGLVYAVSPRLCRYSEELSDARYLYLFFIVLMNIRIDGQNKLHNDCRINGLQKKNPNHEVGLSH